MDYWFWFWFIVIAIILLRIVSVVEKKELRERDQKELRKKEFKEFKEKKIKEKEIMDRQNELNEILKKAVELESLSKNQILELEKMNINFDQCFYLYNKPKLKATEKVLNKINILKYFDVDNKNVFGEILFLLSNKKTTLLITEKMMFSWETSSNIDHYKCCNYVFYDDIEDITNSWDLNNDIEGESLDSDSWGINVNYINFYSIDYEDSFKLQDLIEKLIEFQLQNKKTPKINVEDSENNQEADYHKIYAQKIIEGELDPAEVNFESFKKIFKIKGER